MWSNTAFPDEALYLWAGHLEWSHWLYGTAIPAFPAACRLFTQVKHQMACPSMACPTGRLLQHFVAEGIPVLGVEPAANVAEAAISRGIPMVISPSPGRSSTSDTYCVNRSEELRVSVLAEVSARRYRVSLPRCAPAGLVPKADRRVGWGMSSLHVCRLCDRRKGAEDIPWTRTA